VGKLIFGTGQFRYEVIQPFGVLPTGMEFGSTSHVAIDSNGRMFVTQKGDPPILVFDANGDYIEGWGKDLLVDAHGLFITSTDDVLVADRDAHKVHKFDSSGHLLLTLGDGKPSWLQPFNHPADVAQGVNGDIFVADGYGNSSVHVFSPEGEHLRSWGNPGSGPGEFSSPHGIWVDQYNQVYVADLQNSRIQIFNTDGDLITQWGKGLYHPMDIWIDAQGMVYISEQHPRFTITTPDGTVVSRGKAPDVGHGLWGDAHGNLYMTGSFPGAAGGYRGVVKFIRQ
jgi:DNA-binding beta-propeller fold protein YncE